MSYCWAVYGAVEWTAVWWNPLQNRIPVLQREVSPYASDHVKYRSSIINSGKKEKMCWVRKVFNHCRSRYFIHKRSSEPVVQCTVFYVAQWMLRGMYWMYHVWITPSWNNLWQKFSPMPALAWQRLGDTLKTDYQISMVMFWTVCSNLDLKKIGTDLSVGQLKSCHLNCVVLEYSNCFLI